LKIKDTTNSTEKFRGIYTVGWNFRRKRPNTAKDQIPWEKDRQSVLFYAPAPKTQGNFTVFLLTLYLKKPSEGNKK
jgi:hypothetical protein